MSGNEAFWWVFVTIAAIAVWLFSIWFITMPDLSGFSHVPLDMP